MICWIAFLWFNFEKFQEITGLASRYESHFKISGLAFSGKQKFSTQGSSYARVS
jgi:hypothetical protein